MEVLTLPIWKTSTLPDATFACPDLTTFCRLDELGLEVLGQRLEPDRAVLAAESRGVVGFEVILGAYSALSMASRSPLSLRS